METFLTILAGILILAVIFKLIKIMISLIVKTAIGSMVALAGLLTFIFYMVK